MSPIAAPNSGAMREMGSDRKRSKMPFSMSALSWMPMPTDANAMFWPMRPVTSSGR